MTITGISANDPLSSSSSNSSTSTSGNSALGKDAFMKLLVSQLKNQDPMSPTDNSQTLAQLAQFSSLEQMQQLNDNVVGLALLQQNNALMSQLTQSSALIGQSVKYTDPSTNASKTGTVNSIKIKDNLAVLSIDGEDVPLGNVTEVLGASTTTDGTSNSTTNSNSSN
jgi:flagellar basal-body rod modification protein FlgD